AHAAPDATPQDSRSGLRASDFPAGVLERKGESFAHEPLGEVFTVEPDVSQFAPIAVAAAQAHAHPAAGCPTLHKLAGLQPLGLPKLRAIDCVQAQSMAHAAPVDGIERVAVDGNQQLHWTP